MSIHFPTTGTRVSPCSHIPCIQAIKVIWAWTVMLPTRTGQEQKPQVTLRAERSHPPPSVLSAPLQMSRDTAGCCGGTQGLYELQSSTWFIPRAAQSTVQTVFVLLCQVCSKPAAPERAGHPPCPEVDEGGMCIKERRTESLNHGLCTCSLIPPKTPFLMRRCKGSPGSVCSTQLSDALGCSGGRAEGCSCHHCQQEPGSPLPPLCRAVQALGSPVLMGKHFTSLT